MLNHQTLISAMDLMALQSAGGAAPPVVLDCGFDLANPAAGEKAYRRGHLPGALYAHLDRDLSGAKNGRNGRHPLPTRADLAATLGDWGITPDTQVVCYDDHGMPYAARAWWLLRWMGHSAVAVLDGGRAAWQRAGGTWDIQDKPLQTAAPYPPAEPAMPTIDAHTLQRRLGQGVLLDARAAERFRGDVEPLDPVAGHIPGARLRFFKDNLGADGCYKSAAQLIAEFTALGVHGRHPGTVVNQCGSGVTACHNLLAMAHAGLGDTTLYPGSWSEWCSDRTRPVVRGP